MFLSTYKKSLFLLTNINKCAKAKVSTQQLMFPKGGLQ